ncbi:MAG TPA: hypothetical protein VKB50_10135 [Vicinamibacterales bacterium]|nr:hypothetical protein [Vicinamibacterales bacterium]
MKRGLYLLRFFLVVSPLSGLVVWTFGLLVVAASILIVFAPERTAGALAPLLLLQMFAASSGFAVPARRGHYDLLLTRSGGRTSIALAHWLTSIAPGVAGWLILASVEALVSGRASISLASGTCAAVALVSTIPWAVTIALPRFSGGIGWLLVLTLAGITFSPGGIDWLSFHPVRHETLAASWAFFVYPMTAVGRHLTTSDTVVVAPALLVAVAAMAFACAWVRRATLPLEAAQ